MDLGLTGKTAVITGGSKGIGRAVAELLASEGVNLHLVSRTEAELTITADAIRQKSNVGVTIHPLDLSDSKNIDKLVEAVGDVDILINNAGAIPGGTLQEIEEERWREAWDLKVFGYINMIRAFYRVLKARGGGTIVNVIGMAGVRPDFNYIAGSAGNASLNSLTRAMGGMSMDDGIRVVACNPGPVQTDRLLTLLKARSVTETGSEDGYERYMASMPLGRAAYPEEVADLVVFLASDRASFLSGTVIDLDGGQATRSAAF